MEIIPITAMLQVILLFFFYSPYELSHFLFHFSFIYRLAPVDPHNIAGVGTPSTRSCYTRADICYIARLTSHIVLEEKRVAEESPSTNGFLFYYPSVKVSVSLIKRDVKIRIV